MGCKTTTSPYARGRCMAPRVIISVVRYPVHASSKCVVATCTDLKWTIVIILIVINTSPVFTGRVPFKGANSVIR